MTARQVYERALSLINERDGRGEYHSDVKDFEENAPQLINSLITLLLPTQRIIEKKGIREEGFDFEAVSSLDDEVPLHRALSSGVLPFALASLLIIEEDVARADYFYKLFRDSEARVAESYASGSHGSIKNVY